MRKRILALAMAAILFAEILPAASFAVETDAVPESTIIAEEITKTVGDSMESTQDTTAATEEPAETIGQTTGATEATTESTEETAESTEETIASTESSAERTEETVDPTEDTTVAEAALQWEETPYEIPGYTPQGVSYDTEITQMHDINSVEDLQTLYTYVAEGNSTVGHCYIFTTDITLPADWKPIGVLQDGAPNHGNGKNILPFSGVINGAGHTLTVAEGGKPLLGYVRDAMVCNLKVYGTQISSCGLVDQYVVDYGPDGINDGITDNCITFFQVTILSGTKTLSAGFIGGNASGINAVCFMDCVVEAGVTIGYDKSKSNIGSFGGAVNGYITNCTSAADVYGADNVGGLIGRKGQAMGPCNVNNSAFTGTVTASGNYAGGIIGSGYNVSSAPNTPGVCIEGSQSSASVTGADYVGGILGGEPVMEQCWDNGIGYIRNNYFMGTVHASGSYTGGVIGYLKSLNRYNVIENNRYSSTCGAQKGIGHVLYVDTSLYSDGTDTPKGWVDGTYYMNTSEDSIDKIKADTNASGAYYNISKKDHNRTDDPLGADAGLLTAVDTPAAEAVAIALTVSGDYKKVYLVGEKLDLTGMILKITYSDDTEKEVDVSEAKISGFDSSTAGEKNLMISHSNVSAFVKYTVKNVDKTIKVTVSILGDSAHGDNGSVHTHAGGGLKTWVKATTFSANSNDTVWDLLQTVFREKGISCKYTQASGTVYIQALTYQGVTVEEFDNGRYSGWMYTLNGEYPLLGFAQQGLKNGDVIVFHYTDDYRLERTGYTITTQATTSPSDPPAAVAEWVDIYRDTGDYLESLGTPRFGSIGGEWMTIGLARSGRAVADDYYESVVAYVRENIDENQRLHRAKSTENSRLILALTAIGKDVTNVDGHNLLAGLTDMEYVRYQGINGAIWALIAFDSGNYPIPRGGDVSRETLIQAILEAQLDDGGWALSGNTSDADMTGMALQALSPYFGTEKTVKAAVEKGLQALHNMQDDDGGFSTFDGSGSMTRTSESTAQVIVALTALGIDPDTDEQFVRNGVSALDALLAYSVEDGGFRHLMSGERDGMATEQCYYALTAYSRFRNGQSALYDMTDVIDRGGTERKLSVQNWTIPDEQKQTPEQKQAPGQVGTGTVGILLLGITAGLLLGLILGIGMSVVVALLYGKMKRKFEKKGLEK